ncbi:hypothetical protein [Gimesia chilikensis]|uniref:Uncharacterized protein n=1 Tax=Gimesia chilikensis TaxID=2605989 RepID=A0A517PYC8_9PLAN|nr:hypothetical protein [Gimesia chilikensis]QDT24386.1 hypothetical protein HG66A1_62180 [Gimesia chilikensis]|tara:strand:- start:490 stop:900 length:411 start_codon:yes stop_codon:yes gene_type:complete
MTQIDPKIADWQQNKHVVGMIEFSASASAADCFPYYALPAEATFIGLAEADALCLMNDGTLQVYDHEVENRVLCPVAQNQTVFISALKVLEAHFGKCVADESYDEDESAAVAVRQQCGEIAGGDDYAEFFSMMVGA